MKKVILLVSFLLTSQWIFAHDCHPQSFNCPIDNTLVKFCVVVGSGTFGNYADFQKQDHIQDYYQELINSCPKCHYSGFYSDFDIKYTDKEKNDIKQFLTKYNNLKIDDAQEAQIAGDLKLFQKDTNDKIANCYLIGSYVLKMPPKRITYRKELQNKARLFFIKAIANKEYSNENELTAINYLIAEMYRRTADFENAIKYYDIVIQSPRKTAWIEEMVVIQKELAVNKNEINTI